MDAVLILCLNLGMDIRRAYSVKGPDMVPRLRRVIHKAGRTHAFTVGDRLRKAREVAGYDQRTFEEATGISRGTISAYELGKSTPRRAFLSIWATQTDTDLNWLMTGEATEIREPEDTTGGHDPVTDEDVYDANSETRENSPEVQESPPRRIRGRGPRKTT